MNFLKTVKFLFQVTEGTTGGHTHCKHCICTIRNEDYDTFKSTNKKCGCGHPYYDHDVFN